ncbi:FKBP-type peptidyl-prolyl cis-trans isomerase [Pedobacter sp. SD-b]|uniref:Peptidyl-prolyl cis-trans isomerase n=1 Tax=Pedobacter segetis TaxID=2793069 RepID=A0ABS1BI72_9SPHI|nr:FKBP-type peptidyl-prolyl cis-trans isomerase [Pedobacter segetis]MBK0382559.1 FKBP-type peptidyl-prolyl cis-trans isomerase [Pedobacter segetis]
MVSKVILTVGLAACTFFASAQTKKEKQKKKNNTEAAATMPMSALDSASYSFGLKIASGLKSDGVKSLNYALISEAMDDVFSDKTLKMTDEQAGTVINNFLKQISESKYAAVKDSGAAFLEANKKNPKVVTLPSGLQYEVITMGTGPKPKATDEVTVNYKGSLINGKQFDSSYDRNEPLTLPLDNVIPGWTEGVQLMPVGSKFRFYIPYQLGYGERGAGQDIPPYSTLIFEIELMKIGK